MQTSRAHIAFALAASALWAGSEGCCKYPDRCGGADAIAIPRVHLGAQTGAVTATATYPNSCEIDLDFGDVPIGSTDTASIQIQNIGEGVLDLAQVSPKLDPELGQNSGLELPVGPASFDSFDVTFQPYMVGQVTSTFAIPTNGVNSQCPAPTTPDGGNDITVMLSGNGVQLSFVVQPNVLDFGNVFLGTTATKSVTLINKSTAPVTDIMATLIGSDANLFSVDNAPVTLGAMDSATVDITYAPLGLETRSIASVVFTGSDGEKATLTLFGEPVGVALAVAPNPIDFGFVPLGTTVVGCATASNQGKAAADITGLTDFTNAGGAFGAASVDDAIPPNPYTFPTDTAPLSIDAGASAKLCFEFTPSSSQLYSGEATFATDDPITSTMTVQLTGWGGGPQIACAPASLEFGQVADYTFASIPVICTNIGTSILGPGLMIGAPTASPAVFGAQVDPSFPLPPNGLAPGQSAQIDVSYVPTGTSTDNGTLTIPSNAGSGRPVQIPLSGQGLGLPPCQFAISPTAIDFGNVPPGGTSIALPFEVRNLGTDRCVVQGLTFGGDGGSSFHVASATPDWDPALGNAIVLPAPTGGVPSGVTFTLAFEPMAGGAYSVDGMVAIANPASTGNIVALSGTSEADCLQVSPTADSQVAVWPLDAGSSCTSSVRQFSISNTCTATKTIQSLIIQSGPWDAVSQFSEPTGQALPLVLQKGAITSYELSFEPTAPGTHTAELLISDGTIDSMLFMTGTTIPPPAPETDTFSATAANVYGLFGTPSQGQSGIVVMANGTVIPQLASSSDPNWTYDATANTLSFTASAGITVGETFTVTYPISCK